MELSLPNDRAFEIVGIGRNSWDRIGLVAEYPRANEKVEILKLDQQPGGQTATTIVAAARLGAKTRYLGKFGDDAAGRAVRAALVREGVDLSESKVVPGVSNQMAFVIVDRKDRTRNVFGHSDPRLKIGRDDFSFDAVTSGRILFLGGRNPADMVPFAENGRDARCLVVTDADAISEGTRDLVALSDVVICPKTFPRDFMGGRSLRGAILAIRKLGPTIVCCTLDERGCEALFDDTFLHVPSFDVDVVDTTGAGDVFQGAFLIALLKKFPPRKSLQFASAVAALKCRSLGGQQGIPRLAEVQRFLRGS
ncbi:MAG: PfkB family carbohydrate kinase [Pseudomonadota bacterium]